MSKPILVYAGHSYHQVTSSTQFLLDLLERNYQLSVIWDDGWQPSGEPLRATQINALNPAIVLFFQTLPAPEELRRIKCRRLFLVPMHDYVVGNPRKIWLRARSFGLRALNFCRATHAIFAGLGYESRCVQYWPRPQVETAPARDEFRMLFWARTHEIGWPLLKSLLGTARPERIIIRVAADPGHELEMPSNDEIAEYNIDIVHGWLEKSKYLKLLTSCNVFVAPRRYEGIGQSFLEAMSYGLAVIAPDSPTMNEYIQHGRNGYLYNIAAPMPLDFARLQALCKQAVMDVKHGHQAWRTQEEEILGYLASSQGMGTRIAGWLRRVRWHRMQSL